MQPKSIAKGLVLFAGGGVLFGFGYLLGHDGHSTVATSGPPQSAADRPVEKMVPEPKPPLALLVMRMAVVLQEKNPDVWRTTYLNKRYRVVGTIAKIVGTTPSEPDATMFGYSGPVFRIALEPWDLPSSSFPSDLLGPEVSFIDLPQATRLAMLPGQHIDANCILTSQSLKFGYCRLNKEAPK
jgi:hypothetical protein